MDQSHHPVLVPGTQQIAAQFLQLFLIDHLETTINERLVGIFVLRNRNFPVHQQFMLIQFIDEGFGACTRLFEPFTELQDFVCSWRRLAFLVEQRIAFFEFTDRIGSRIEAQRKFFRFLRQPCEHEGVAANIGRNIDRFVDLAGLVHEGIHAFVQPHQGQRKRVFA